MNANPNETLIEGGIFFDNGYYDLALIKATTVLEASPNDDAALELEKRAVERLLIDAESSLKNGDYDSALRKTTVILNARPNDEEALKLNRRARKAVHSFASPRVRSAIVPVAATLAVALLVLLSILSYRQCANNCRYYDDILTECRLCLNNGYYESALMKTTIVLIARPNDEAARNLERVAINQLLSESGSSFQNGYYESALAKATIVLNARPDDERARILKKVAVDQLLVECKTSLKNGDYDSALRYATIVLNASPDDEGALELKKRAEEAIL